MQKIKVDTISIYKALNTETEAPGYNVTTSTTGIYALVISTPSGLKRLSQARQTPQIAPKN